MDLEMLMPKFRELREKLISAKSGLWLFSSDDTGELLFSDHIQMLKFVDEYKISSFSTRYVLRVLDA